MLTGRPPFRAATALDTVLQVLECEPQRPRLINPRVDRDLETVCLKCLEKDPRRRYTSAAALADDLESWLAGEPITARPAGRMRRLRRWVKRRPFVALGIVLVVVMAGLAARMGWVKLHTDYTEKMSDAWAALGRNELAEADAILEQCPTMLRDAVWHDFKRSCARRSRFCR